PHRNAVAAGECRHAVGMIGVLVRDENRGQVFGQETESQEARGGVAHTKPAIDHHARAVGLDNECIAFAAAAEGCEAHLSTNVESRGRSEPRVAHHFNCSFNSERIFSPVGPLSGVPFASCTVTRLRGSASATTIRYCSGFSVLSFQNISFDRNPGSFFTA